MIVRAAVKIFDKRQNKEIIVPCHRHCDAFQILKEFGYRRLTDYEEISQGFLDEHDNFLTRTEAWQEAYDHHQFEYEYEYNNTCRELFSEDLW